MSNLLDKSINKIQVMDDEDQPNLFGLKVPIHGFQSMVGVKQINFQLIPIARLSTVHCRL